MQRAIAARMAERSQRTEVAADRALLELARVGFSDLRRIFDADGRLKRPEHWDADTAAAISSVKVVTRKDGEGEVVEIKLWDKASAVEKLGKHLRLFDQPEDKNLPPGHLTEYDEDELFEHLAARRANRGRDVTAPKVLEG